MKEFILSEKAKKALGEMLLKAFYIWDWDFKIDNYFCLGITCEICGKKTDNKYYSLDMNDFGKVYVCIDCFKNEIEIKKCK